VTSVAIAKSLFAWAHTNEERKEVLAVLVSFGDQVQHDYVQVLEIEIDRTPPWVQV